MRKIRIKIVKLPPEAKEFAKKLEDTLSKMIARVVKAKVGASADLENLEITVNENISEDIL